LYFRRAATFNEWWQAVSTAADLMDFLNLSLPLTNRDGSIRTLIWRQYGQTPESNRYEVLKINVPIRDRRIGSDLNLKIEICRDGSLESAGRRIALFTRLIEEHDIASLPGNERLQQSSGREEAVAK
jgi:hypothetical protein